MAKILVVEDERLLSEAIVDLLQANSHVVETAYDGMEAAARLRFYAYDLVIMDWELPGQSGIEAIRAYRANANNCRILMLTGRNSDNDRVVGLNSGADDYLCKPFDMRELSARVKALLRRPSSDSPVLATESLILDVATFTLKFGERAMKLLPKEVALMELLIERRGSYIPSEELMRKLWAGEDAALALRQTVRRLRKRAEDDLQIKELIDSERGQGYRLSPHLA